MANEIEREYLRRGIIAACFVPGQEIKEGVVILQVVEAKMGDLEVPEHKYFKRQRITYYWKLKPAEVLRYDKISRSLQLMNKNPDREVKATLHAGKRPQTTDVLLNVNTRFPLHFTSTFDREGSVPTGIERRGLGIRHNNLLGLDDTLLSGYTFGDDFSGIYTYHLLPISSFGTSLLYGYSYSKSFPKKEYETLGIDSRAKNTSFFLQQDIFRKDEYLGEICFGIDTKDKTTKMNSGTINRDRLRILRLGNKFLHKDLSSTTSFNLNFSQGINLWGARRRSVLSSRGAKNTFTKFNLGMQYKKTLPLNLQANLRFDGQLASTNLAPQEEFYLGGINSVRGYPSGDFLADNALQTNLEILIPVSYILPQLLKENITALIFFDQGYGKKRRALPTEKKSVNLSSVGTGLRIRLFKALLRLEWGFPVGDATITEEAASRFHFSLDFES